MGASQKRRLLEAHTRTARKYKLIPYTVLKPGGHKINMLHIESR